ncbi:MAG: zf-HC2 domain-containing protein [Candidatus Binatia bacterium]
MTIKPRSPACSDFERDLVLYYYKESPADECRRIESHLQSCFGCKRFLQELASLLPLTLQDDEPPQAFWESYSRALRRRLARAESKPAWWNRLSAFFVPWPVPATAAAVVVGLAVTLALGTWSSKNEDLPPENEAVLEVMPIAENLELLRSMEFLDALDLLDSSRAPADGAA